MCICVEPCLTDTRLWCKARRQRPTPMMRFTLPPCRLPKRPWWDSRLPFILVFSQSFWNWTINSICHLHVMFCLIFDLLLGFRGGIWNRQWWRWGAAGPDLYIEPAEFSDPTERPPAPDCSPGSSWYTVGGWGQAEPHAQATWWEGQCVVVFENPFISLACSVLR